MVETTKLAPQQPDPGAQPQEAQPNGAMPPNPGQEFASFDAEGNMRLGEGAKSTFRAIQASVPNPALGRALALRWMISELHMQMGAMKI